MTSNYYYSGDVSLPKVQEKLKIQFIEELKNTNFQPMFSCSGNKKCIPGNVLIYKRSD